MRDRAKTYPNDVINNQSTDRENHEHSSLTKREYFAAVAMQGLLVEGRAYIMSREVVAEDAVRAADALIAELNKE